MKVTPVKTSIVRVGDNLEEFLDKHISSLQENSVVVVTGKIIALCDKEVVPIDGTDETRQQKWDLVKEQSELYTDPNNSSYNLMLTVKDQVMAVNAGIDESNADGNYVLLPQHPYESAEKIWQYLKQKHNLRHVGVLIIDSRTLPLKWGIIGTSLAHCGFAALNNKIGEKDLFGHEMQMTQENVAEGLAIAANLVMGEVAECQPIAIIEDIQMVEFQELPPFAEDLDELWISLKDDAYSPIIKHAPWKKGGKYRGNLD